MRGANMWGWRDLSSKLALQGLFWPWNCSKCIRYARSVMEGEMTERNWRDSIRALGSHIDLWQDEQVKKTKIGINSLKRPQALQYYWRSWDCPIENKYTWSEALRQEPRQCYLQHRLFGCALPERVNPVLIVPELGTNWKTIMNSFA